MASSAQATAPGPYPPQRLHSAYASCASACTTEHHWYSCGSICANDEEEAVGLPQAPFHLCAGTTDTRESCTLCTPELKRPSPTSKSNTASVS
eukprot:4592717-Amphidinium_carterae.1